MAQPQKCLKHNYYVNVSPSRIDQIFLTGKFKREEVNQNLYLNITINISPIRRDPIYLTVQKRENP